MVTAAVVLSSETIELPAENDESSDTPEVPVCDPVAGTGTSTPAAAAGPYDTSRSVTDTVPNPAVAGADHALLAAALAVKAFAASLYRLRIYRSEGALRRLLWRLQKKV